MDITAIIFVILYAGGVVLGVWIVWSLIRSAVRRALRDHQLWLESRPTGAVATDGK
jgi:hypothetical protein